MRLPMATPNTCPTLEAGSVLTSSTRLPASASWMARGAGNRGLADAALAGEEQEAGRIREEFHRTSLRCQAKLSSSSRRPPLLVTGRSRSSGSAVRRPTPR